MSWPQWPAAAGALPTWPGTGVAPTAPQLTAGVAPGTPYTPEQWAAMQQQNWQQWVQWQQQYQQWQQQYGEQYQKSMSALTGQPTALPGMPIQPPLPAADPTVAPPPLPDTKPPLPPEEPPKLILPPDQPVATYNANVPPPSHTAHQRPPPQPQTTHSKDIATTPYGQNRYSTNAATQPPSLLSLNVTKPPQFPAAQSLQRNQNFRSDKPDIGNKRPGDFVENQFDEPKKNRWESNPVESFQSSGNPNTEQIVKPWSSTQPAPQKSQPWSGVQRTPDKPAAARPNVEELSEAEKNFDKQFEQWEAQFNKWKDQNAGHPDKQQYKEYEAKWESWRAQLLERREQMRKKRLGLAGPSSSTTSKCPATVTPLPATNFNSPHVENKSTVQEVAVNKPATTVAVSVPSTSVENPSEDSSESKDLFNVSDSDVSFLFSQPPKEQRTNVRQRRASVKSDTENTTADTSYLTANKSSDGIPGLDLVKDDDGKLPDNKNDEDVSENEPKRPDLEAITKGINTILGDQKLMSMLSLVSQHKNPEIDQPSSCSSLNRMESNNSIQNEYNNSYQSNESHGNQIYPEEQYNNEFNQDAKYFNEEERDYGHQNADSDNSNIHQHHGLPDRGFPNRGPLPPHNFNQGPPRGTNNFNQGPPNFNQRPPANRGPNDFNQGPPPRGINDFVHGPPQRRSNEFSHPHRGPQDFNSGPIHKGPNNFNNQGPPQRGSNDFNQGLPPRGINEGPLLKGQNDFTQGPPPRGPPNDFSHAPPSKGTPDFNQEPPDFNGQGFPPRGPNTNNQRPHQRGPNDFNNQGPSPRGSNDFSQGPPQLGRNLNQGPFGRGPNDYNQGPPQRGSNDFTNQGPPTRGPNDFSNQGPPPRGPNDFSNQGPSPRVSNEFSNQRPPPRGSNDFSNQGPPVRGPSNFTQGPPLRGPNQGPLGRGPDEFNEGPPNRERPSELNTQSQHPRGPNDFAQGPPPAGPNNFNEGPQSRGTNNFNQGPPFRGPNSLNRGPPGRGPNDFNQGPPNNFNQGPPNNFNQGPPNNFNQGQQNRGLPNQNWGSSRSGNFNQGPDNFSPNLQNRGSPDFKNFNNRRLSDRGPGDFMPSRDQQHPNQRPPNRNSFGPNECDPSPRPPNRSTWDSGEGELRGPSDQNQQQHGPRDSDQLSTHSSMLTDNDQRGFANRGQNEFEDFDSNVENFDQQSRHSGDFGKPNQWFSRNDRLSGSSCVGGDRQGNQERSRFPPEIKSFPDTQLKDNEKYWDEALILKPATVFDYGHKSLNKPVVDSFIEPVQTFDYGHTSKTTESKKRQERDFNPGPPFSTKFRRFNEPVFNDKYRDDQPHPQPPKIGPISRNRSFEESCPPTHERKLFENRRPPEMENKFIPKPFNKRVDEGRINREPSSEREMKYEQFLNKPNPCVDVKPGEKSSTTMIEDLLSPPGRNSRPPRIVIILRGPPGSGKTFLAKLIKDKEVEQGGCAPRILSLDDYFMVEQDKEVIENDTGRKTIVKEMVYEYEECMEISYRQSLERAFKKTITDGFFPFIILDCVNDKVKHFGDMWSFAKQNGFQVYVSQMELDVGACTKRNVHHRSEIEIERLVAGWEPTPSHYLTLDATSLIQAGCISEVEMEEVPEVDDVDNSEDNLEGHVHISKWERMEHSGDKLARLDGTSKPLRPRATMEDYLQLDDEIPEERPGQKRVRWADLEERRRQEKIRAIGFVVGQTDWDRMMDPTQGGSALTQTKYIERVRRF